MNALTPVPGAPDGLPAHSLLGASGMSRWMHCPGSFRLSQRAPHRPASIHAATGTVAHTLIEHALRDRARLGHQAPGLDVMRGTTVTVDRHDVLIDDELLAGASMMAEYVAGIAVAHDSALLIEARVRLDGYFASQAPPPVPLFGRADVLAYSEAQRLLEVVDYKNGSGVIVGVRDNPQLLYYAAGALLDLSDELMAIAPAESASWVRLTVVQPNARTQEKIKSWDVSALDVLMWVDEVLIPAVRACEQPDAPFVPGSWCRFCPVAQACPRLLEDAQAAARQAFSAIAPMDLENPATVSNLLTIAENAERWIIAAREFAFDQMNTGAMDIPGWGLVPKRAVRQWVNPEGMLANLRGLAEIDPRVRLDDYQDIKMRSPAQVEKSIGKKQPDIWKLLAGNIESKSSGLRIARVGDTLDDTEILL